MNWVDFSVFAILGCVEIALLGALRKRVRDTTLVAAWWWAVVAALGVTVTECSFAVAGELPSSVRESGRFMIAALTFCPAMAVLGAKRPQHQAWQFVVFSLWGIVALPAAENLILRPGQSLEIQGVRGTFLAGLVALGLLNWIPTRLWMTALLMGAGQIALFAKHLPGTERFAVLGVERVAAVCFLLATMASAVSLRRSERLPKLGMDGAWRDFRDLFGALWALRVVERVNAAASMSHWPVRLTWSGFRLDHDASAPNGGAVPGSLHPLAPDILAALRMVFDNLLRRFVNASWIAKRRDDPVN